VVTPRRVRIKLEDTCSRTRVVLYSNVITVVCLRGSLRSSRTQTPFFIVNTPWRGIRRV